VILRNPCRPVPVTATLISLFALLAGCAGDPETVLLKVDDYVTLRRASDVLYPLASAPTVGAAWTEIEALQDQETDSAFDEATRIGAYVVDRWPRDRRAALIAYRSAWIALFRVNTDPPIGEERFRVTDDNLLNYSRAAALAERAIELDKTNERYWRSRAGELMGIITSGYQNPGAFRRFLDARILSRLRAPRDRDAAHARQAEDLLVSLRRRYPEWEPALVERELAAVRDLIEDEH
jgi:hypothetical protein